MAPVHQRKDGLWSRLHDVDKPVMLKDVSDNLKNYAISGAAYALGVKLSKEPDTLTLSAGYTLGGIAIIFLIATFCQSWVLAQKQSQQLIPFTTSDRIRNGPRPALKLWFYLLIPVALALITIASAIWWAKNAA